MLGLLLQLGHVPIVTFVIPKSARFADKTVAAQIRACFAEKTVLCGKGFLAKCSAQVRVEFAGKL